MPRLLTGRGFVYDSSMMADGEPYIMDCAGKRLVEAPPHWSIDDWPPFAHYEEIGHMMPVRGASEGLAPFFEEFDIAEHTLARRETGEVRVETLRYYTERQT